MTLSLVPEPLFTITEEHLDKGLRGIPVGHVRTSRADPQKGISYVGYPIKDLVALESEKVIHLLLYKELPDGSEDEDFRKDLQNRAQMPEGVLSSLETFPSQGHPMEWFINGIGRMGMHSKTGDYVEDGLNLIARISELVAAIFRIRSGWGDPIPSNPDLGYVDNFVHMLGHPKAHKELPRLLKAFHVLHMDHGGGNLSTFVGKAVASGRADMYASMLAAMAGLSGPRHGRANQDCLEFVEEIGSPDKNHIRQFTERCLMEGKLIFGFGHAVLLVEDPRAAIQYEIGKKYFSEDLKVRTCIAMREVVPEVLGKNPKISNPYPNVDAISGSLLYAAGLQDPDYYTVLFGWSRVVGIVAQIIDEQTKFRDGKGVPIYRCKYLPEGQEERRLLKGDPVGGSN